MTLSDEKVGWSSTAGCCSPARSTSAWSSCSGRGASRFYIGAIGEEATVPRHGGRAGGTGLALPVLPGARRRPLSRDAARDLRLRPPRQRRRPDARPPDALPRGLGRPAASSSISAPIATQVPQAVGAAWAARIRGDDMVALTWFGEGATSANDFHTGANFAGVHKIPVVLACRNNGWAISVPRELQTASETIAQKAVAYGIHGRAGRRERPARRSRRHPAGAGSRRGGPGPDAARVRDLPGRGALHVRRPARLPERGGGGGLAGPGPHPPAGALPGMEGARLARRTRRPSARRPGSGSAAPSRRPRPSRPSPRSRPSSTGSTRSRSGSSGSSSRRSAPRSPPTHERRAHGSRDRMPTMNIIQAVNDALRARDAARPERRVLGEDVGKFGGRVPRQPGIAGGVRQGAGHRHAARRERRHRDGAGHGALRAPAGPGDPVRRLHLPRHGPDRERGGQVPLPLGRRSTPARW